MKIAVTGASGAIGSYVVERLIRDGHDTIGLSRRRSSDIPPEVWSACDVTDRRAFAKVIRKADAIVHLAHSKDDSMAAMIDVEQAAMRTIVEEIGDRILVYCSSQTVYGNPDGGAWAETAKLDPQSWYDLGKIVCEYMVRAAPTAHRIVFRAPLVLSSNNARNGRQWLGALYDALLSGMGFGFESEEAQRTAGSEILIAEDFAAYVASAIGRPRSGTFNISGGFVRWCDMIDVLARTAGVRPQIVYFDPDRPLPHSVFRLPQRASRLDCSLAAGAYPLPAFGSWADSIERYVAQERALRKASGN